jgi:hypothetical protein
VSQAANSLKQQVDLKFEVAIVPVASSISFGKGVTDATPGSFRGGLIVSDIEAAHKDFVAKGINTTEVFHGSPFSPAGRISGSDPERKSYSSYVASQDPDGNAWIVQEVTHRSPGRIDPTTTNFGSASDLASAIRRAAAAPDKFEKRTGQPDANWPDWYAKYVAAEQAGTDFPK